MNILILLVLCILPAQLFAISLEETRHLALRTGFLVSVERFEKWSDLTRHELINKIIEQANSNLPLSPEWAGYPLNKVLQMQGLTEREKVSLFRYYNREIEGGRRTQLRAWWVNQMIATDSPVVERMTLFWHGHFTSGFPKVKHAQLMYQQNQLFRDQALGNFRNLLYGVTRDPAMMSYLDNNKNIKGKPNENFSRELLELYALGEGNYSESDVKEAARAFTGWSYDPTTGKFLFNSNRHDGGEKKFMGKSGPFNGDDIVDILLGNPRTAEFIVEKLWREFVSPQPDPEVVAKLAIKFRESDYEIKPLLKNLLLLPEFWSKANRNSLVKSPVELLIGTAQLLKIEVEDAEVLAKESRVLGQNLFQPPDVKGWPGYFAWINEDSMIKRQQVLLRLHAGYNLKKKKKEVKGCVPLKIEETEAGQEQLKSPENLFSNQDNLKGRRLLYTLFLGITPDKTVDLMAETMPNFVRMLLAHPAYQLK